MVRLTTTQRLFFLDVFFRPAEKVTTTTTLLLRGSTAPGDCLWRT